MVKCPVFVQISGNLLESTNRKLLGVIRGFLVCYQVSVKFQILRSDSWQIEDPLPISVYGIRAVNFRNTILTFGN